MKAFAGPIGSAEKKKVADGEDACDHLFFFLISEYQFEGDASAKLPEFYISFVTSGLGAICDERGA